MSQAPLTDRLRAKIARLFSEDDRAAAEQWLLTECDDEHIHLGKMGLDGLERIRAAVLKLSNGSMDILMRDTRIAQRDWRDALVFAGFGNDLQAHVRWMES
ncbi:MAG TPA: hypothetical protein VGL58_04035 [Caulobacteraceae bacterium]|jgi:hypothetical protein